MRWTHSIVFCGLSGCTFGPRPSGASSRSAAGNVDRDGDGFQGDRDCNDDDAAIHPQAVERCNGLDDNCNGDVDEGLAIQLWRDADGDGWGDGSVSVESCAPDLKGYSDQSGDCDDRDPLVHPAAGEHCTPTNTDDDCDGLVDTDDPDLAAVVYVDQDDDGWGGEEAVQSCEVLPGTSAVSGDCDDTDASVSPDAFEVCDAAWRDEDCDGGANDDDPEGAADGVAGWFDDDGDGYGASLGSCAPVEGLSDNSEDCDDTSADAAPGLVEVCADHLDNDCDGRVDDCGSLPDLSTSDADRTLDGGVGLAKAVVVVQEHLVAQDDQAVYVADSSSEGELSDVAAATIWLDDGQAMAAAELDGATTVLVSDGGDALVFAGLLGEVQRTDADFVLGLDGFDGFGHSLHLSDSGIAVVTSPFEGGGRVDVFDVFGSDEAVLSVVEVGSGELGKAVTSADLTGDGVDDIVAGAPQTSGQVFSAGAVAIVDGARDGIVDLIDADTRIDSLEPLSDFGDAMAVADLDGDGWLDLAVTAPLATPSGLDPYAGVVQVFRGPVPDGVVDDGAAWATIEGHLTNQGMTTLATGDLDGDRFDDLALGMAGAYGGAGAAAVFLGPLETGTTNSGDARRWVVPPLEGGAVGQALFVADETLFLSAPADNGGEGHIWAIDGNAF